MNEAEEQEDVTEFEEEKPSSGGSTGNRFDDPVSGNSSALVKFVVGCALTIFIGSVFLKFQILTKSTAAIAIAVQVTAFVVYFMTSGIAAGYEQSTKVTKGRDVLGPERRMMRRRTAIRFFTGLMIAFLAAAMFRRYDILEYPAPWKIVDPASPSFVAAEFRFPDYRNKDELAHAAEVLFPVGTSKANVDRILYGFGHAIVKPYQQGANWKKFAYGYSNSATRGFFSDVFAWMSGAANADRLWYVFVTYDASGRVINVAASVDVDNTGATSYTQISPDGAGAQTYTEPASFGR